RGVHHDVQDIETVRRHFGIERLRLIGHSYVGLTVKLYAREHSAHLERVVSIGPMQPSATKQYPPQLKNLDETAQRVFGELERIRKEALDPVELCRRTWDVLRPLYVADPKDAHRIQWDRCELPNERNFMSYWMGSIVPSIRALTLDAESLRGAKVPILIV